MSIFQLCDVPCFSFHFQWVGVVGYVQKIVPENRFATGLGLAASCAYVAGVKSFKLYILAVDIKKNVKVTFKLCSGACLIHNCTILQI